MVQAVVVPKKLYLSWQSESHGSRYIVGELVRRGGGFIFRYISGPDLEEAKKLGFQGHSAFKLDTKVEYKSNALEVFSVRLPGRSRTDFFEFLRYWDIEDPKLDDYALLAVTGGRLPTDSFELIAPYEECGSCEFLTEVAGLAYAERQPHNELREGSNVELRRESGNPKDPYAVGVYFSGKRFGYVKKVHAEAISKALSKNVLVRARVRHLVQNGVIKSILLKISIG